MLGTSHELVIGRRNNTVRPAIRSEIDRFPIVVSSVWRSPGQIALCASARGADIKHAAEIYGDIIDTDKLVSAGPGVRGRVRVCDRPNRIVRALISPMIIRVDRGRTNPDKVVRSWQLRLAQMETLPKHM
jgi:hypothetical protein